MEGERAAEMERRAIAGGAGAGPSSLAILPIKGSMGREVGPPTQGHRVAIPDAVASSLQQRRVIRWERFLPRRSLRVLLVEPDDSTRHIVTALLRKSSYHVAAVADGVKAWDVVKEKSYNFDLILSEVEVPSISGISLLSKIMGSELSRNIPVIMMSSQDSVSVVFRCMQKGAVDFLVKPVRKNELRNLWQHVWRRHCSISYGNGPENMPKNQSLSESMSDNDAAINDARDSKMAEGGDDSDDLSSGSKPLVPIHIEDKEEKQSQKLEEGAIDSILGSNDNRCARNGFQEKDVLNHSAASAFSRYANTGICSLGQKSQPQLQRSDLESPQDQRPPADVDGGDRLQASAAPHFGMLPFPFPVNATAIPFQNFCASGYGPLVPPMFYHEPSAAVDRESEEEIQHPSLLGEHSNGGGAEMVAAAAAAAMNGRSGFDCGAGKDFDPNRSHREAALMKFRMKRKDRCFEKKVRYHSRKMLAEQRPRVKGQFVRQPAVDPSLLATEMEN